MEIRVRKSNSAKQSFKRFKKTLMDSKENEKEIGHSVSIIDGNNKNDILLRVSFADGTEIITNNRLCEGDHVLKKKSSNRIKEKTIKKDEIEVKKKNNNSKNAATSSKQISFDSKSVIDSTSLDWSNVAEYSAASMNTSPKESKENTEQSSNRITSLKGSSKEVKKNTSNKEKKTPSLSKSVEKSTQNPNESELVLTNKEKSMRALKFTEKFLVGTMPTHRYESKVQSNPCTEDIVYPKFMLTNYHLVGESYYDINDYSHVIINNNSNNHNTLQPSSNDDIHNTNNNSTGENTYQESLFVSLRVCHSVCLLLFHFISLYGITFYHFCTLF